MKKTKKFLSLLIVLTILLSALAACQKNNDVVKEPAGDDSSKFTIPEGLTGTDVIKLMLASERLDTLLLKNEGDIFENGSEVMRNLSGRARSNLSDVKMLSKTTEAPNGGKLKVDGNTFEWSNFVENCNSHDYFKSLSDNIISSAETGAKLIDDTKKYVRIIDKWVSIGEEKYYLSVDENSETIYRTCLDEISMCRRLKNDDGKDVYILYVSNDICKTRMYYVPGERYEFSSVFPQNGDATYFVADNSKGFWETLSIGGFPDHYNVSCFVMKDDICYDAIYDHNVSDILVLKTISNDRKADIFFFSETEGRAEITLHLGAFDGIESVEITASPDEIDTTGHGGEGKSVVYVSDEHGTYATSTGLVSATVNLANGQKIVADSTYANGTVQVNRALVTYGNDIYTGEIFIYVNGKDDTEKLSNLKAFLDETGLTCRKDIDSVFGGIRRAHVELDSFVKYHKWNGFSIATNKDVSNAEKVEFSRFEELQTEYDSIKDAEVIDFSDKDLVELNINFAKITSDKQTGASFENMGVTVEGLELTVEDTTLLVKNEPYTLGLALIKTDLTGGLIHIDIQNESKVTYTGTSSFTVNAEKITGNIPSLDIGDYTLVTYIATSDMIRASQYIPVRFTKIASDYLTLEGTVLVPEQNEKGEIILKYVDSSDVNVTLTSEGALDYAAFFELLAQEAYKYGVPSEDLIEKYDPESESFSPLTGSETAVESGIYRLSFSIQNAETSINGYLYAEYGVSAPEA